MHIQKKYNAVDPFFVVRNAYQYSGSSLSRLFSCEKDMFYRFMNDGNVKWCKLLYAMNLQLLRMISRSTEAPHDKPVYLIIDDTDALKGGRKSEIIGKIFSHLEHRRILGYKCLTLLYTDGLSQMMLDFSLHGEEGRKSDRKQGLSDKERKDRFSEGHRGKAVEESIREYTMKKTNKAIEMVKYAIKRGIRFNYLLVDGWFTNADFVRLITNCHIKCQMLGMVKLGMTKYHTKWDDLNASQIIEKLQKKGLTKHYRTLKCIYSTIDVKFAGTSVRLFFSKRGRKGQWNGLLTTDLSLSFLKAYRTYPMRWATEVAYHDQKQLLDFGKYQSVHFSAQIANFTLTMMQYNILCTVKRFEAYETIGVLFRDVTAGTLELSVTDRIWELILDTILEIAEMISADASELLFAIIDVNPKFHKIYQMYNLYVA